MAAPVYRPAARVVLLDPEGRILLFRVNFRDRPLWITPGGGIDAGETSAEAAKRELWEETGIEAPVGRRIWTRRHLFEFNGVMIDEVEDFYIVRLDVSADVTRDHWLAHEHEFMTEHRWWSCDEIAASTDYFAPRRLAELLPPIVRGEDPAEPFDCGV